MTHRPISPADKLQIEPQVADDAPRVDEAAMQVPAWTPGAPRPHTVHSDDLFDLLLRHVNEHVAAGSTDTREINFDIRAEVTAIRKRVGQFEAYLETAGFSVKIEALGEVVLLHQVKRLAEPQTSPGQVVAPAAAAQAVDLYKPVTNRRAVATLKTNPSGACQLIVGQEVTREAHQSFTNARLVGVGVGLNHTAHLDNPDAKVHLNGVGAALMASTIGHKTAISAAIHHPRFANGGSAVVVPSQTTVESGGPINSLRVRSVTSLRNGNGICEIGQRAVHFGGSQPHFTAALAAVLGTLLAHQYPIGTFAAQLRGLTVGNVKSLNPAMGDFDEGKVIGLDMTLGGDTRVFLRTDAGNEHVTLGPEPARNATPVLAQALCDELPVRGRLSSQHAVPQLVIGEIPDPSRMDRGTVAPGAHVTGIALPTTDKGPDSRAVGVFRNGDGSTATYKLAAAQATLATRALEVQVS